MEEMLGIKRRAPIVFRQFFHDYRNALTNISPSEYKTVDIKLQPNCFLNLLTSNLDAEREINTYEPGRKNFFQISNSDLLINDNLKLNTFYRIVKWKEISKLNPFTRSRFSYKLCSLSTNSNTNCDDQLQDELLITVRVYRTARATQLGRTIEKPVFAEEFQCIGSNFLTELRDKIYCISNNKRFFDISESPGTEQPTKKTDPGYFFIHDTFYNDKRNAENVDYSETVQDWISKSYGDMEQMQFKTADMAKTRFIDLTASLQFPQLYFHHANCEHLFVFSQLEYLPHGIGSQKLQYPLLKSFNVFKNWICHMCGTRRYCFVVEKSTRHIFDPSYLCSTCFYGYNYKNGKKIGEFKAYRIFENDITSSDECESTDDNE